MSKLNIGRIPIMKGEFVVGKTYNRLWQVTCLGSTYQSRIDNNTSSPAEEVNGVIVHKNTDKWLCIADASQAMNSTKAITDEVSRATNAEKVLTDKDTDLQSQISTNNTNIANNQKQITDNKSQQDEKNSSLDDAITKLNTRSSQIEDSIKGIAATGGASVATAVTYDNAQSGLVSVNAQGAIDEIVENTAIKDEENNVVQTPFHVIENEEYLHAITDSEDRLLFGIERETGKPYFPLNEMYHVEQNEEFFAIWLDADDHVLLGIKRDGQIIGEIYAVNALKQLVSQLQSDVASLQEKVGTIDTSLQELLSVFSLQDNEEYLAVETDSDGRVLAATYPDGSHYAHNLKSETIPTEFGHIEDPEGRMEITTDSDGRVLGYRDEEGTRHEHKMVVKRIEFSSESLLDLAQALNSEKLMPRFGDFSSQDSMNIPIPDCAVVNIFSTSGARNVPDSKSSNSKCFLQFHNNNGVYFKKKVIVNAQGNSSLGDPKKNLAIDICNDDWIGDNTCPIKFGNWVAQDSFHLKAYYYDTFVGIPAVGYELYDEIVRTRGIQDDRAWKRAMKLNAGLLPSVLESEDITKRIDSGARGFPAGFPCILFWEGKFYGIYSWQLKKHRDNYAMDKKEATHIHLDGAISSSSFFCAAGAIDWDIWNAKKKDANNLQDGIEIRNPKSLIGMDGSKYDFDSNAVELIDETSELYDSSNKDIVRSAKVKSALIEASKHIPTILQMITDGDSKETIRGKIEEYFDVESIIDYIIFTDLTLNVDGLLKNWQWMTYDGVIWSVQPYDLDMTFGLKMTQEGEPFPAHQTSHTSNPYGLVCTYYSTELTARYKQLRDLGIINTNHIVDLLDAWTKRIGIEYYKLEQETWVSKRKDNIYRFRNWVEKSIANFDSFYKYN